MLTLRNVQLSEDATLQGTHGSASPGFTHHFAPGDITVVLGSNRAGKTDLCRLIAGLDTDVSGDVELDGVALSKAERHVHTSMVYQSFVNYPNLTVAQNIASPLKAARHPQQDINRQVQEMAERLRIADLLDRMPHELSGGQQQRVAIARALAKQARIILLDEPLVNLDFKLREALEQELREVLRDSGAIVVYTSSDPQDAFALGDHLLLLNKGAHIQSGPPEQVYSAPNSLLAMSMLCDFQVNEFVDSARQQGICGLRPEHAYLVQDDKTSHEGSVAATMSDERALDLTFPGEVTALETNGDRTFVHCAITKTSLDSESSGQWLVRHDGMLDLQVGQSIMLGACSEDVRWFARG